MNRGLSENRALVTAVSRGLGSASAVSLAREGARVVLASCNFAAVEGVADSTKTGAGARPFLLVMNLGDRESIALGAALAIDGGKSRA
jgi:3-oxoacyl-[acyl-carrier protein] reductase